MDISCPSCRVVSVVSVEKIREISAAVGFHPEQTAEVLSLVGIQVPQVLKTQAPVLETPEGSISDPTDPPSIDVDISEHPETHPPKKRRKISKDGLKEKLEDPALMEAVSKKISGDFSAIPRHKNNDAYTFVMRYLMATLHLIIGLPLSKVQAISIDTVLSPTVVDGGYKIDYEGGFQISNALFDIIGKFVGHRKVESNELKFFVTWAGKPVSHGSSEMIRLNKSLDAWKNSDNNDNGQQVDSYRRILDHYPVSLGRKCPNFSQLKALGFTVLKEAKALQQRWRHDYGKLDSRDWLSSFKKNPPTLQQCEDILKTKPYWRLTAKVLLKGWVPRSSRNQTAQSSKPRNQNFDQCLVDGKWPGLAIKKDPVTGRGLLTTVPFSKGDVVCDYHGKMYQAPSSHWKTVQDTSYLFCLPPVDGVSWYVDAIGEDGSFGRLINHSKNPSKINLHPVQHKVDGKFKALLLVAKRDILAGEELWYAYGDRDKGVPDWMKS